MTSLNVSNKNIVENQSLNSFVAIFLLILYGLWGTGWDTPLGVSWPGLWYLTILFLIPFQLKYTYSLNNRTNFIVLTILAITVLYSLVALPKLFLSEDSTGNINYLLMYTMKSFISALSIIIFYRYFSSIKILERSLMVLSITIFLIYIFLHWKYYYDFNKGYLGVSIIDEIGATRSGKNSIATSMALIFPIIIAYVISSKSILHKFFGVLGLIAIAAFAINLQSRSMVLIIFIGFSAFIFFMIKIRHILIIFGLIIAFSSSNINYNDYIYKENSFDESQENIIEFSAPDEFKPYTHYQNTSGNIFDKFLYSHRGWLLRESLTGFKDSIFLGNGVSTFRIRESNLGSRTESHNDYTLVLYEQGIFGFFAMLLLLIYRIKRTISINLYFPKKYYITGSFASLISLSSALFFINIYNTQIFWVIIALNIVIVDKFFKRNINF